MRLFSKLITLSFLFSINYLEANNYTQDYIDPYTHSVNGGIGLIEVPNARFSNDGEFGFGVSLDEPFNRVYGKVQIFPWMEAVLRYTEGQFRPYSKGSGQTWKDKGIDFKFRLMQESESFPQIAVGVVDTGCVTQAAA